MGRYLLDANSFINAKNDYYRFDFCPAYWEWIIDKHDEDKVFSLDKVKDEILQGQDQLSHWIKEKEQKELKKFFLPSEKLMDYEEFKDVSEWVNKRYPKHAKRTTDKFLAGADMRLVVYAKIVEGYTVVTHERLVAENSEKVKIPNDCNQFGIKWISPFDLLAEEKAKFVLENKNTQQARNRDHPVIK